MVAAVPRRHSGQWHRSPAWERAQKPAYVAQRWHLAPALIPRLLLEHRLERTAAATRTALFRVNLALTTTAVDRLLRTTLSGIPVSVSLVP